MQLSSKFITLIIFIFGVFLLFFKIYQVPPGIDTDEGSIAYNALLISKTYHDENNRLMPFFILSADKIDWKQPVLVYTSAIFFKIFGASFLTFKSVNIVFSLVGAFLLFLLLKELFPVKIANFGLAVYFITPGIIMASRIGNETIDPILFSTGWLLTLLLFLKTNRKFFIVITAIFLGLGFYSFKGMRIIVPIWIIISIFCVCFRFIAQNKYYQSLNNLKVKYNTFRLITQVLKETFIDKKVLSPLILFLTFLTPFFIIIPFLEKHYPGAVFDRKAINVDPLRHYLFYWVSNLSIPSLFFKGDVGKIYETPLYGFLSIGTLPFYLSGIVESLKRKGVFLLILLSYLATPILFGFAGSLDYPHRLVAMIPLYIIITTLGIQAAGNLYNKTVYAWKKLLLKTSLFLLIFYSIYNFIDFAHYYYISYPKFNTTNLAFHNQFFKSFYALSKVAHDTNYQVYVQEDLYDKEPEGNRFYEGAYFSQPLKVWKLGNPIIGQSILLTQNDDIEGFEKVNVDVTPLTILIKK